MSAEELRDAAKVLRERADVATSGPWSTLSGASNVWHFPDAGSPIVIAAGNGSQGHHIRHDDARWIATMHPGVGLALADLLETLAYDREVNHEIDGRTWDRNIVPLARLILGERDE